MAALQDVKQSVRQLARTPIFTLSAVLTLAAAMGVNAVAFTAVNGVLFKGPAASAAEGVGRIATSPLDDQERYASLPEFERIAAALQGAARIAAEGRSTIAWQHDGISETAWVLFVSPDYFSMVGPRLIAGSLRVQRRGADVPTVLIGERFWRDKLQSPSLAGLMLRLNNTDVAVAGVMAESFTGPAGLYSPDIWLPLDDLAAFTTAPILQRRDTRWLFVMARPDLGVDAATLQGHLDTAVAEMAREWPGTHKGHPVSYFALGQPDGERTGVAVGASIGMGVIGLVLLLACFNVANLLLARAAERERDMGIRTALGARPWRVVRLVVTEGFLIAILAGALALLLAWWTQSLLATFAMPIEQPQHIDLRPDRNVVFFIGALMVVAGVLPGLWPAWVAARVNVLRVLGSQGANTVGGRPAPLRRWLVGAQVTGSTAFLAVAALLVQSYMNVLDVDPGFDRAHLVLAQVEPSQQGLDRGEAQRYLEALHDRVRSVPGVASTATALRAPFFIGYDHMVAVWPEGGSCEPDTCPKQPVYPVSAGYFSTMGIALAEGREFTAGSPADEIVTNGEFARALWPDGRALGRVVRIGVEGRPVTVVGVTSRTRTRGLDRERPALFMPIGAEHYDSALTIVARTTVNPSSVIRAIADAAMAVNPDVPVLALKTMHQQMAVQMWPFRTLSWMFGICGGLALLLASIGLSAIVIHSVNRRIREFGVRLSIGATPRDLVRDVLENSVRLLVPGLIVGLMLAAAGARLAQFVFVGVNVLNPLTYAAVALLQAAIVLIACVGPALRASRTDPLVALRAE